jgi:hypothetical protein
MDLFVKDAETFSERMTLESIQRKTRGGIYGWFFVSFGVKLGREFLVFGLKLIFWYFFG